MSDVTGDLDGGRGRGNRAENRENHGGFVQNRRISLAWEPMNPLPVDGLAFGKTGAIVAPPAAGGEYRAGAQTSVRRCEGSRFRLREEVENLVRIGGKIRI